jgi:hypothetical protein
MNAEALNILKELYNGIHKIIHPKYQLTSLSLTKQSGITTNERD